jgi:PDZ domain-containing protein
LDNAVTYSLPATVAIDTNYIGGPSGGLAMSLAIYDRVTTGRLTGRHRVAVTGTISSTGAVGEIGGVAKKALAAETAHADIFLVPSSQASEARAAVNGKLRVVGVNTFKD